MRKIHDILGKLSNSDTYKSINTPACFTDTMDFSQDSLLLFRTKVYIVYRRSNITGKPVKIASNQEN